MNKSEMRPKVERLLESLGEELRFEPEIHKPHSRWGDVDLFVKLRSQGRPLASLLVDLCANPRLAPVAHAAELARRAAVEAEALPVVAVPRLSPGLRRWLRDQQVGYLDLDGRAYLQGEGLLIDRDVDRDVASAREFYAGWSGVNYFADRSSLVLRYLLERRRVRVRIREVAAELKLSLGLVSQVMSRLRRDGYLKADQEGFEQLSSLELLCADWVDFYKRRAHRQRERRFYMHARDVAHVMERLRSDGNLADFPQWGLSYQAGASLISPFAFFSEVHVLVGGAVWEDGVDAFVKRFELEPARDEANLILVEPYYHDSWSYGMRSIGELPVVSDLQLYLDLSVYPRRGSEQASRILQGLMASQSDEDQFEDQRSDSLARDA